MPIHVKEQQQVYDQVLKEVDESHAVYVVTSLGQDPLGTTGIHGQVVPDVIVLVEVLALAPLELRLMRVRRALDNLEDHLIDLLTFNDYLLGSGLGQSVEVRVHLLVLEVALALVVEPGECQEVRDHEQPQQQEALVHISATCRLTLP